MDATYDAIVVGSGFGGGIAACRLAEAGLRVAVLERGRRFAAADFPATPAQAPAALWHPTLNPHGLFDLRLMRDLSVVTAAGVGGGSLVYANVQLRTPADVFQTGWPQAIDRDVLDPYYDRTEEALLPMPTPRGAAQDERIRHRRPAHRQAGAAPAAGGQLRRGARPPVQRRSPEAVRKPGPLRQRLPDPRQEHDRHHLRGARGAVGRAGVSAARSAPARTSGPRGQRLRPPERAGGMWSVGFRDLERRSSGTVQAPTVVLAAGTLGSTRLLLKNRSRLPSPLPRPWAGISRATATRSALRSTRARARSAAHAPTSARR